MQQVIKISFLLFFSFFLNFPSSFLWGSELKGGYESGYEADDEREEDSSRKGRERRRFRCAKGSPKVSYADLLRDYFEAVKSGQYWFLIQLEQERFEGWDASDGEGCSALHRAAEYGQLEVIEFLLRKGLSPDLIAPGALSPYAFAWVNGHEHCLHLLEPSDRL